MKVRIFIAAILIYSTCLAQDRISWSGKLITEYLPEYSSNFTIGGQLSGIYEFNENFYTSISGLMYFIPRSFQDCNYTALRSISLSSTYEKEIATDFYGSFLIGVGVTSGKIMTLLKEYGNIFTKLDLKYFIKENISVFIDIGGLYDLSNKNITPSFKIGFQSKFIIVSFDFSQYISWDNPLSRVNNYLAIPYIIR